MKKVALLSAALAAFGLAFAAENEADWDWIDAKEIPVEGRPFAGTAWVNVVGRLLDVPVVSMGFNGNGKCEPGMAEVLARTDASAIVLQAFANMYEGEEKDCAKFEAFVREVRARAPETPIVLLEYMYPLESRSYKHTFVPKLYEKLKAEDRKGVWAKLDIVRVKDTFAADSDMTSDGGHLNDYGQRQLALAVSRVLGPRLGVPVTDGLLGRK